MLEVVLLETSRNQEPTKEIEVKDIDLRISTRNRISQNVPSVPQPFRGAKRAPDQAPGRALAALRSSAAEAGRRMGW